MHQYFMIGTILNAKPKKWIALVLGFLAAPLAFLYVDVPRWAVIALAVEVAVAIAGFLLPGGQSELVIGVVSFGFAVLWAWFAYRLAGKQTGDALRPWYARWYGLVAVFVGVSAVVIVARVFFYEPFRAPSTSMTPTVPRGANLVVNKWGYGHFSTMGLRFGHGAMSARPERGDIIAFDYPRDPRQTYIKRIVGLPGDKIVYRNKRLLVNGADLRGQQLADYLQDDTLRYLKRYREKLGTVEHDILIDDDAPSWYGDSAYTLPEQCTVDQETISCTVPADNYFVLGDNRDNSMDSRMWGFVPARSVIGKVVAIVPPRG
jgi:signal peptidase I